MRAQFCLSEDSRFEDHDPALSTQAPRTIFQKTKRTPQLSQLEGNSLKLYVFGDYATAQNKDEIKLKLLSSAV